MIKPLCERKVLISKDLYLSIDAQCELLSVRKSGLYYKPVSESDENLIIMRMLDEQYYKTPFYGCRKLTEWLKSEGFIVNRKRVKRLMGIVNWQTIYRKPRTTIYDATSYKYPYLL